jgi:methanogenic corrinoid protein MtbC1
MGQAFLPSDEEFDDSSNRDVEPPPDARALVPPAANADLVSMIERYIIPRMMLAHGVASSLGECERAAPPSDEEIEAFADLAVREDVRAVLLMAEAACRRGLTVESLLMELIAPAARLLGDDWESDRRSFAEVTAGAGTLHHVVNVFASRFAAPPFDRGQVLLTAPENEQHTLGLNILAELLRRAGWVVDLRASLATKDLLEHVATERLEAVGFTVSNERLLDPLARLVAAVRHIARNPQMAVFVGGPLPLRNFAARCGAVCPGDAPSTVRWLDLRK